MCVLAKSNCLLQIHVSVAHICHLHVDLNLTATSVWTLFFFFTNRLKLSRGFSGHCFFFAKVPHLSLGWWYMYIERKEVLKSFTMLMLLTPLFLPCPDRWGSTWPPRRTPPWWRCCRWGWRSTWRSSQRSAPRHPRSMLWRRWINTHNLQAAQICLALVKPATQFIIAPFIQNKKDASIRAPVFSTSNNAINNFQTSFNRIVINY